jgi:hypothetical protein
VVCVASHQLEPEGVLTVAVHEEVQGLAVAVPPLVRVLAGAGLAAEDVAVAVEEEPEERGHPDGVGEDEDVGGGAVALEEVMGGQVILVTSCLLSMEKLANGIKYTGGA